MEEVFGKTNTLVIENNHSMRQIMISMLRIMGFKSVIVANSEKQCLDIIYSENINLIICGWAPPKLDALPLLLQIRDHDKTINTPFIIVSTIIEQNLIKQAVLNGVSEYIVPPFNKLIFENKIAKALKLPVKKTAKNVTTKLSAKQNNKKRKSAVGLSILVVDDIAENIEIISQLLQEKYSVKAAINAKIAKKICLSETPPDLILLDIMMPDIDGLTLCKELKASPITQNIPIIFLSALSENQDVVKGLSLGAVDYITKPIIPEILLARINVHASILRNQQTIQSQIDELIHHNTISKNYHKKLKKESDSFIELIEDGIIKLRRTSNKSQFNTALEQIDYATAMVNNLINKAEILDNTTIEHSELKSTRLRADKTILPLIEAYGFAIHDNQLERFEEIPYDLYFYANSQYFNCLFNALYRNTVEAAAIGSRISVEVLNQTSFILIKIHNSTAIAEELESSFMEIFTTSRPETATGLGMYTANLICKKIGAQLYYHSSEKYGTTFYLKLKSRK